MTEPILQIEHLVKHFREGRHTIHAVNDVSFEVYPGEAVALVGESGCGKSTTAQCIIRLQKPTSGRILFNGEDITLLSARQMRQRRRSLQMVYQDPNESLNPQFSVRRTLREPLALYGLYQNKTQILAALHRVNLDQNHLGRRPHQLSGGQKQRVGMARAMMTQPQFVVLDEPTSSLDMSLRLQTLNLLRELQREFNMAYLFISHDLSTVRHLCDRVLVMYLGRIVEAGRVEDVFNHPRHVYTQALLSAIPIPDPTVHRQRLLLAGETPSARQLKPGCGLQNRCPHTTAECRLPVPFYPVGNGHVAACRLAKEEA
ncbi:MAG: ABC transporter ATP-binding protein [Chloroflexi bacterium]|nr:ABC transporter ATP-binding protein [Chloroflexota bacterium]